MSQPNRPLIAIVEDEHLIVDLLTHKLASAGYGVVTAEDGQAGWDVITEHRPALAVIDYRMPVMNGLELCRKLAANPDTAGVPVLLLTSLWREVADQRAGLTNLREVIPKPFSPSSLVDAIDRLMGQSRDRRSA